MEIPRLEDFGVSPKTGFLPETLPLQRLSSEWDAWEDLVSKLPDLIESRQIRSKVDKLPLLNAGKLNGIREQRRAYSILGFLAHAYVWSPPEVCEHLPKQLSDPLITLGNTLGLPPLATYAGLCLWNYKTIDGSNEPESLNLGNLKVLATYTNTVDEAWFYLISVAMERQGGPCLGNGLAALRACLRGDEASVIEHLDKLTTDIVELTAIMMRMPDHLNPQFFFNNLRPFLAGWKGMEKAGLPRGVVYGDEKEGRLYCGGSNGQSSLIQALDIILNIEHHALGHRTPPGPVPKQLEEKDFMSSPPANNAFLLEMRRYMPREHREFLYALEKCAVMRPFVLARGTRNPNLTESYDRCLKAMRSFRSKHIQIVMRYISLPARGGSSIKREIGGMSSKGIGLSSESGGGATTGTGGTDLMNFLKQTRDEVSDAAAGDWNRSILSRVIKSQESDSDYA